MILRKDIINFVICVLQFSLQDNVQDMRQVVLDRPESCYRTCFSLIFDGVRLDDFAELHMIEGLKDNCVIKVVEGKPVYTL
jgi:protein TIF31